MMTIRRTNFWTLVLTTIMIICVYRFYTVILHPEIVYPSRVDKILYLDEQFNQDEVELMVEAAAEWEQSTGNIVHYTIEQLPVDKIDYAKAIIVIKVSHFYPEVLELDYSRQQVTLGYCNSLGDITYIAMVADRLEDETYRPVMLHELGHSLGLRHNEGDSGVGTLMYPSVNNGSSYITKTDLVNFCKLYRCDPTKLQDQEELLHP